MSRITSIDVTYSSNGSPHSAKISTIEGGILHPDKSITVSPLGNIGTLDIGSSLGSIAGTVATNLIANNFVVDEITTSTDPYKTTKTYRLIDKASQILDGYAILVRGQNVSPFGGINYKGRAYDAGEVPPAARNGLGVNGAIKHEIYKDEKIIILGRTRSVFTPSVQYGNLNPAQNRIHAVYEAGEIVGEVSLPPDMVTASIDTDMIKQQIDSVSLLYGYTLSDVKLALEDTKIGLDLDGFPTAENALFNTSGSIRSVLSSIASAFGLYWYVHIGATKTQIKFLNASNIVGENNNVQTFYEQLTNNNLVIEKSISDRGYGPTIISSFRGTTEPLKPSQVVYRLPGSIVSQEKMFKVKTEAVLNYGDSIIDITHLPKLFALFSWFDATEEEFDKFFWALNITDNSFSMGDIYPSTFQDKSVATEKQKIQIFQDNRNAANDEKKYYELRISSANRSRPKSPSELGIYQFCKAFFNSYGRIYISAPFKEKNETLSSSAVNIATNTELGSNGSYLGSTKLSAIQNEIPEIESFLQMASIAKLNANNATVLNLYEQTSSRTDGTAAHYYFIGTRAAFSIPVPNPSFDSASIRKRVNDNIEKIDHGPHFNYIGVFDDDAKKLGKHSEGLFDQLIELNDIASKFVYATVSAIKTDGTNQDNQTPATPTTADSSPDMKYNEVFYNALSQEGGSNVELRHYEGSIKDAEIFAEFYPKDNKPVLQKSASAKYYGLVIPDFDITLDSVNISVGSEGIETTVTRSTKNLIPIDQGVVLANNQASNNRDFNRTLTSSQKRIFNR
jgi:hypothetical protein